MVDLQGRIDLYQTQFAAGCKTTPEIAISPLRQTPIAVKNSLRRIRARILFVRIEADGTPVPGPDSVDVLLEASLLLEVGDEQHRLVGRPRAELRNDIDQRAFDVL